MPKLLPFTWVSSPDFFGEDVAKWVKIDFKYHFFGCLPSYRCLLERLYNGICTRVLTSGGFDEDEHVSVARFPKQLETCFLFGEAPAKGPRPKLFERFVWIM